MAIDLNKILQSAKKTYSFVIKIAVDCSDADIEKMLGNIDTILKVKGMINRSKSKSLPLAATPIDFPRLKDFAGQIHKLTMDFEYPITPNQLTNELINCLLIDRAFIIVRTAESPLEQYDDDYLKYKDEDYAIELLKDNEKSNINVEDLYGDDYNKELVKKLQSKEAKIYQQGFKELDKKLYNGQK